MCWVMSGLLSCSEGIRRIADFTGAAARRSGGDGAVVRAMRGEGPAWCGGAMGLKIESVSSLITASEAGIGRGLTLVGVDLHGEFRSDEARGL